MQQRQWHELGQALRDLRMSRDLAQKEIISRAGEAMAERTLRAYESGEQRPSRDRLLRLMIRSFELANVTEINRYLQLAGYALLSEGEILQAGLIAVVARPGRATSSPGAPVDFRIEVSTLTALDGQGREVWRHEFPARLAQGVYQQRDGIRRCTFADIDGDGGVETLFVHFSIDSGAEGATLICFGQDGKIKWQFEPGRTIRDTRQEYCPPYFISNVIIIPLPNSGPRILVSSNHYLHNPNQVAMLEPTGELISEYWHSGHLLSVRQADLNGDGVPEILLAGVNNGYRQATMVIFDPRSVSGASTQPNRQILGFSPGTEKAIVLFPRTCLSKDAPYNRVADLHVTKARRIMLAVVEGVSEAQNPGVMIYELDFTLRVISARPDSHLQENHRLREIEGVLDHSWTEEENEQLRRQVVVKGGL